MHKHLTIGLGIATLAICATGCGSSEPTGTSAEQKKAFEGGPMPESARKQFEASQQAAAQRAAEARANAMSGKR